MIALVQSFARKIMAESAWLVLLAVAAVAAWLYVDGERTRADRDRLAHAAELICARSGTPFPATTGFARGTLCADRIAALAAFQADTARESAAVLAQAMRDHDARQTTDTLAARTAAEAARSAAEHLETADAHVPPTNIVDRAWFAAVNGAAGLRAPAR